MPAPHKLPALKRWLQNAAGPAFSLKEIHLISWLVFCAGLAVLALMWIRWERQGGRAETLLGPDHATFYIMGRIVNEYAPERIYDLELQERLYKELRPHEEWGYANPYPPFLGLLFAPLAKSSFLSAYLRWSAISLMLYLSGILLLIRRLGPLELQRRSLILCFSLSFYPFVLETLYNGQLAAVGFFAIALALHEEDSGRPLLSGLSLALCLYKPTLLTLLVPYLLISRRFKSLLGLSIGAGVLFTGTSAILGISVWQGFARMLVFYAEHATGGQRFFRTWKYLDLNAFWRLAFGGRHWLGLTLFALCAAVSVWCLVQAWRKVDLNSRESRLLSWALTLTWTLLLNLYVPIYDSLLVIPSLLLTASTIGELPSNAWRKAFTPIWTLFLVIPWFTQSIAEQFGLQVMTLLLVALAVLQFACFQKTLRSTLCQSAEAFVTPPA